MSITLEELRDEWTDRSNSLDARLRSSEHLFRDEWIERRRTLIWKLTPFGKFAMAAWIAALLLLGHFLGTHADQPALFIAALVLDLWVIAAGVAQLRQQHALRNLDFGLPLLELQRKVEILRIARIRTFNRLFLTGQIVWWIPFVVVIAGASGVNLYLSPQFSAFALWNIAGGIAFIPIGIWLARRYGERLGRKSLVRHIADSIAGRDIAAARETLQRLRRFHSDFE